MPSPILKDRSAISEGIKTVGVGKKGSKPLSPELAAEILQELSSGSAPEAAKGAFWGALLMKGISQDELLLERFFPKGIIANPDAIVDHLSPETSPQIKNLCSQLLRDQELNKTEAIQLGDFLFSNQPGDALRGLTASILRVRYETPDEYEGLLLSLHGFFEPQFKEPVPAGRPIIQIAEPFDGVDHSNMITPAVAGHLQNLDFRVVCLGGRNSGPKFVFNLYDIAHGLGMTQLTRSSDLTDSKPRAGFFLDQKNLSKALDRWVDIRRQTIKRPFLSTIERFVNPFKADILIASAFHPPYGEKMLTIAERMGFKNTIIVRNGIEGTIAFPLKRAAKMLISTLNKDNNYIRQELEFDAEEYLKTKIEIEEKLENPSLDDNIQLIKDHFQNQKTANRLFDLRIKATCEGLTQALKWINKTKEES